jgi:histidinol-phosphate phosphatase family protein
LLSQALILCGGLGTRLGERVASIPKPMLPINDRPFLDILIQETARYGIDRIVLLAGRFGEQIASAYDGRKVWGAQIEVLIEPAPLGTGGALKFAESRLDPEFLVLNGDSWIDADLVQFAREWTAARMENPTYVFQMLLHTVPDAGRFGSVVKNERQVTALLEKSPDNIGKPGLVNAGVYLMTKQVVEQIRPDTPCSLETDVLPRIIASGSVAAVAAPADSFFIDIGIPETYVRAQSELRAARTRPAVFFDRDGTLNHDTGYTHRVEDLVWMPDAQQAIATANARGYFVFVVTNQAGIARGLYDEIAVQAFHREMQEQLCAYGGHIDAFEWCPHHAEASIAAYRKDCRRRKPAPGMINDVIAFWPVDATRSILIGNSDADMQAAKAAGVRPVRYEGGSLLDLLEQTLRSARGTHVDQ